VFHISIWGLGALFGEAKPTKGPPWRRVCLVAVGLLACEQKGSRPRCRGTKDYLLIERVL